MDALEEAVEDGVLREDPERVGRYAFAHALVRATLYDSLSALRRARLHGKVGEALIDRRGAQLDAHLGQLAHHFALAAPAAGPERAVDFALAAGRRADQLLAWEEAADHYAAALRARDQAGEPRRTGCAASCCWRSGPRRSAPARRTRAPPSRRRRRRRGRCATPPCSARAALGFAGRWSQLGRVSEEVAALLQEALAELGEEHSPLRARLLARLALELYYAADTEPPARPVRRGRDARPRARRSAHAGDVRWTPATTRCGARRRARAARRGRGAARGSRPRSATPSSSWKARAGPWSTCSSSAT